MMSQSPYDTPQQVPQVQTALVWGLPIAQFNMLMHLSQLLNYVVPFAGIVLPIIMWVTNKDQFKEIDAHGKVILNWMISGFIYTLVSGILAMVLIGLLGLLALLIVSIVFPIIGGIKAKDGELWPYPLSIKFFV